MNWLKVKLTLNYLCTASLLMKTNLTLHCCLLKRVIVILFVFKKHIYQIVAKLLFYFA